MFVMARCTNVVHKLPSRVKRKVRSLPTENKAVLEELIFSELNEFEAHTVQVYLVRCSSVSPMQRMFFKRSWKELITLKQNQTFLMTSKCGMRPVLQRFFPS